MKKLLLLAVCLFAFIHVEATPLTLTTNNATGTISVTSTNNFTWVAVRPPSNGLTNNTVAGYGYYAPPSTNAPPHGQIVSTPWPYFYAATTRAEVITWVTNNGYVDSSTPPKIKAQATNQP